MNEKVNLFSIFIIYINWIQLDVCTYTTDVSIKYTFYEMNRTKNMRYCEVDICPRWNEMSRERPTDQKKCGLSSVLFNVI